MKSRWMLLPTLLCGAVLIVEQGQAADKPAKKPGKTAPVAKTPAAPVAVGKASANAKELSAQIDRFIDAKLAEEKVPASPLADDAEFLRRVYLDIAGVIPTSEKAKAFLDSKDADKRAKLIDELLASPDFGKHQADIWQDLFLTRTSDNRRMQPAPFIKWLTESFNANKPWDKFVQELLTASGDQEKAPGVTFFLANSSVDKMTDNVAKNILGIQLQCAQCHNHPFTGWKQTEYWGMATFFMKVKPDNTNAAAKNGTTPGVSEGPQINRNKRTLPESAKMVNAKFLQGEEPKIDSKDPYRPVLSNWITSDSNPFFAKAMVNRLWFQFFGRGLVNPVDDMHENNVASHPELLEQLGATFKAVKYDVKEIVRAMCNSKTYQRTSKPIEGNVDAESHLYARMNVKMLMPEVMYDSLIQVSGPAGKQDRPVRQGNRTPTGPRDSFVSFFRGDEGGDPTEYNHGIPQALRLMNSNQFNKSLALDKVIKNSTKPEEIIEELYLSTLSRRPSATEVTQLMLHVKKAEAPRLAYNDILWALLNSSEFALNR